MPDNDVPRRTFLRGVTAATALSYPRVYGANERIQLGLIGAGERGRGDMGKFVKSGIVDVTAVCDVYAPQIVVVFAAARGLLARLRSWTLRRRLARQSDSRVLVLAPTERPAERRGPIVQPGLTPPAHLPARRD